MGIRDKFSECWTYPREVIDEMLKELDGEYVPLTRTINGKPLSSNITLSATDVNAVPKTRTVNSKALSSDITLDASDVSAVPASSALIFNYMGSSGQFAKDSPKELTIPNSFRGVIFVFNTAGMGLYLVMSTSQGAVYVTDVQVADSVTHSETTNKITFSSTTTGNKIIAFMGNGQLS